MAIYLLFELQTLLLSALIALCFNIHVGEVLRQTNHLSTLFSAFLDQSRAGLIVLVHILGRTELHKTDYAAEVVLLS